MPSSLRRRSLSVGREGSGQRVKKGWREWRVDTRGGRRLTKRGLAGQWGELAASAREDWRRESLEWRSRHQPMKNLTESGNEEDREEVLEDQV